MFTHVYNKFGIKHITFQCRWIISYWASYILWTRISEADRQSYWTEVREKMTISELSYTRQTILHGSHWHVIARQTILHGSYWHVIARQTILHGSYWHAIDRQTMLHGSHWHVIARQTILHGSYWHVIARQTILHGSHWHWWPWTCQCSSQSSSLHYQAQCEAILYTLDQ